MYCDEKEREERRKRLVCLGGGVGRKAAREMEEERLRQDAAVSRQAAYCIRDTVPRDNLETKTQRVSQIMDQTALSLYS